MRHANLVVLLLVALACLWMVYQNRGFESKLDVLVIQQEAAVPVPPQETTLITSWCHTEGEPPTELHTRVNVPTEREPPETPAQHKARHDARVAAQLLITPNNCENPDHPLTQ